jgi:hypothetical protein
LKNTSENLTSATIEEQSSPNVSSGTLDEEQEDDERSELIVRETSPNHPLDEIDTISAKKKGKRPMRGKN